MDESAIGDTVMEGETVHIPIILGNEDVAVDSFNGIVFSIRYNPDYVREGSVQLLIEDSWLGITSMDVFGLQQNESSGHLDIALTRYGQTPISGNGQIATFSFIIEDNVVDLLPGQTGHFDVFIENIQMVDDGLEIIPVASDTIQIIVHSNNTTGSKEPILESIRIYPNPVVSTLFVQSADIILELVELYNVVGERVFLQHLDNKGTFELNLSPIDQGMYFLKLYTEKGVFSEKLIIR